MAVLHVQNMLKTREVSGNKPKMNKKDTKRKILVSQELKIARALAGNDKTLRSRALKSLKKWFHHRSESLPFTEEDFLRLWKGLFYSMWMSDKPLVQEECAENIASLLHELPFEHALTFFKCGLLTLANEWFGIDQLRLDKFLMFVRRLLRQALFVLKKGGYSKKNIVAFGEILNCTILDSEKKDALGLFMHFSEIFLEELSKVGDGQIKPDTVTEFLVPFVKCLAVANDDRKIKHIKKFIFIHLMNQSDVGLEYQEKYNAWKREGFPGTIHGMQKIDSTQDDESMLDENENPKTTSTNKALDPRAGRVDVELPQINFHAKAISNLLLKFKHTPGSTVATRSTMTLLSKQFVKLSHGVYPLGVTDLKVAKLSEGDMNIRKAVNRLVKFDKKITGQDARTKKRKLKAQDNECIKRLKLENDNKSIEKVKKNTRQTDVSEEKVKKCVVEKINKNGLTKENKKRKTKVDGNIFTIETPIRKKRRSSESLPTIEPESTFERNSGLWFVYKQDDSETSICSDDSNLSLGNFLEKKIENIAGSPKEKANGDSGRNPKNKTKTINEPKNESTVEKGDSALELSGSASVGFLTEDVNTTPPKNRGSPSKNMSPSKELFPKNPWDEPLEEGEYEICIPSKSYVEKLKKISRKSTINVQELINNSLGKSRTTPDFKSRLNASTPQSMKRVKINTKLNQSQEFDEYHTQMITSPAITYDASKKPGKPLLKTPVKNSPINPFYKQLCDI